MLGRTGGKRHAGRARRGQSMVEFTICIPVFLLFVFGIFQAVLIYKTQSALNQAATDAARTLSAQSSSGAQGDAPGLDSLRAALVTLNLNNLSGLCSDGGTPNYNSISRTQTCGNGSNTSGIDVFSDDGTGNVKSWPVFNSEDMIGGPSTTSETILLDNHYVYSPTSVGSAGALCPTNPTDQDGTGVYQFSLTNSLDNMSNPIPQSAISSGTLSAGQSWGVCKWSTAASPAATGASLPWNGAAFDSTTATGNMNGRHDQRCDEETIGVKIRYNYFSAVFPVHWGIQLVGTASMPIEPRQYEGNSATVQATTGSGTCQ
jgi:Flp pilus assembly protein TadG